MQRNFFTLNAALETIMKDIASIKEEVIETVSSPERYSHKDADLVSRIESMLKGNDVSESPNEKEEKSPKHDTEFQPKKKRKRTSTVPQSVITKLEDLEKLPYCKNPNFRRNLARYESYDEKKRILFLARKKENSRGRLLVGVTLKDLDSVKSLADHGGWEICGHWESKLAKAALTLIEKLLADQTVEEVSFGYKKKKTHTFKAKASKCLEEKIAPRVVEFIDFWVTESDYLAPGSPTDSGIFDKPVPNIKRDIDEKE